MDVRDILERCENRLSFLSNKLLENGKTKQQIKETADSTKSTLHNHIEQIKKSLCQQLDQSFERLCLTIDETVQKDLDHLAELEEIVNKDMKKLKKLAEQARGKDDELELEDIDNKVTDMGKSHLEMPVVSLSFATKINESAMMFIDEKIKDIIKLGMTGSVQIVECLERPGAIIVRWDEQPESDSESIATDTSTFAEYILQATTKSDNVFYTIYEGESLEYTMNFAEPNKEYRFRVCQSISNSSGTGICGAWSVVKTAVTCMPPHVWCEEDCVTDSDLKLYQLSNGGRTATKIFPESSRILRSKEPSYRLGQQLTFWVEETGESSSNDGIGLICGRKQLNKQFTAAANTAVMTSKGIIFVNGARMTTRLPSLKKNSVLVFQASRLHHSSIGGGATGKGGTGKFRVSISVDDKEVTFDWTATVNEDDALFFGCVFEHTGWQLSVG